MTRYRVGRRSDEIMNVKGDSRLVHSWEVEWYGMYAWCHLRRFPTWRLAYDFAYREARKETGRE